MEIGGSGVELVSQPFSSVSALKCLWGLKTMSIAQNPISIAIFNT
jgi:hypothetical protein